MNGNQFIPKMSNGPSVPEEQTQRVEKSTDSISAVLYTISNYTLIVLIGVLPLFFTVGLWASLSFSKVIFTVFLSMIALVTASMMLLRKRRLETVLPLSLVLFWIFVGTALASGLLSGDVQDALRGRFFETQTVGFFAVLALAMSAPLLLQNDKIATSKALSLFSLSATLIIVYNLLRLILGAEFLAFGSFADVTVSPIGSFNDLAIFAAMAILFGLITLLHLPLKSWLQYLITSLIVLSLFILSIVNFFNVWLLVCFFSFSTLLYLLSRDTIFSDRSFSGVKNVRLAVVVSAIACIFSVIFVVAGDFAGAKITSWINVNQVEVRPSASATLDVARAVYNENALLGIGPNKFSDAWRIYKDPSINQTLFWNTDFTTGSGFIPTMFVNLGILGGVAFILFFLSYIRLGYRILLRGKDDDFYWYYFAAVSFALSLFVWIMSFIYNPGTLILLLGALFTGLTFVAAGELDPAMKKTIPLVTNRRSGFLLMAAVVVFITIAITSLFSITKQYIAQSDFTKAQITADSIESFRAITLESYGLYPDDTFIGTLAQVQIGQLNSLITIPEPTETEQQIFFDLAREALALLDQATQDDATNPVNHALTASAYSSLATAGIDGAAERAVEALKIAQDLDPLNPAYELVAAQMAFQNQSLAEAREAISAALQLRGNSTQALHMLSQLEIVEGNVESAIVATQATINLEPNNPARYYQLGLLLSSAGASVDAIRAFNAAIALDTNYANARYFLALEHLRINQIDQALEQLQIVAETNSDNVLLSDLINRLESGEEVVIPELSLNTPVTELAPEAGFENSVISTGDIETDLVAPVNTVQEPDTVPVDTESVESIENETDETISTDEQ